MTKNSFTPRDTLDTALQFWWFVAALMLFGAVAGWGFQQLRPAVYEGRASLATGIDYARTGPMSDLEEDQAMELVGDVIKADDTKERALDLAQEKGIQISADDFNETAYLERQNFTWVLRVRHTSPQTAALLTNVWLDAAYAGLEDAYGHALVAEGLLQYSQSLTRCLENSVSSEPVQALCSSGSLAEIQSELLALNEAKTEALLASRGLFPAMAFSIIERAAVPTNPVQFDLNTLVFSGAVLGFLAAVWLVYLRIPEKLFARNKKRGNGVSL